MNFNQIYLSLLIIVFPTGIYRFFSDYGITATLFFLFFYVFGIFAVVIERKNTVKYDVTITRLIALFFFLNFYLLLNTVIFSNIEGYGLITKHIYGLAFFLLSTFIMMNTEALNNDIFFNKIKKVIYYSILVSSLLMFYEAFILGASQSFGWTTINGRADGFFKNPNEAGRTLVLLFLIYYNFENKKNRTKFYFLMFLTFFAVLASFSKGAILMMIASILLIYFTTNNLRILPILAIIIFFTISNYFVLTDLEELVGKNAFSRLFEFFSDNNVSSFDSRLSVLQFSFNSFIQNPFFGSGLGTNFSWNFGYASHNNFMFYAADTGILGLLSLIFIHALLFNKVDFIFPSVFLLNSFFTHNTFMNSETYIILAFYVCLIHYKIRKSEMHLTNVKIT